MNPRSGWQARSPGCNPGKTLPPHPARPAAAYGGWPGGEKVGNDPNSQGSKTRPGLRAGAHFVG
ncbi:MAG: hypothetical protein HY774_08175 [Acidobacteria bacterium]|nr:hypothetical protein [Acidobacteriota bacterium]